MASALSSRRIECSLYTLTSNACSQAASAITIAGCFLSSANIKCYIVLNGEDLWIHPKNYGGFLIDFTPSVYQRQPYRIQVERPWDLARDSGQRSWHIPIRITAHPRGAFISVGDWTPTETNLLLLTTWRCGSLLDWDKIIPISDFRAAWRLYFEKTIINKY